MSPNIWAAGSSVNREELFFCPNCLVSSNHTKIYINYRMLGLQLRHIINQLLQLNPSLLIYILPCDFVASPVPSHILFLCIWLQSPLTPPFSSLSFCFPTWPYSALLQAKAALLLTTESNTYSRVQKDYSTALICKDINSALYIVLPCSAQLRKIQLPNQHLTNCWYCNNI